MTPRSAYDRPVALTVGILADAIEPVSVLWQPEA